LELNPEFLGIIFEKLINKLMVRSIHLVWK
jgi:hypothetical protein